ncbi:hypothetical protein [Lentibacillus cibarius]|uniref:Uncharacterized protein n=1 Tax=Lentibacillus cibarius TaxID=2583219 RepID=A0A5S3QL06_9BACI|nr:hypothetical protein [Lentibacillus cibarius]TMN21901.1 hypothetical protein FFL34_07075 [Lentibacillus cibarius]
MDFLYMAITWNSKSIATVLAAVIAAIAAVCSAIFSKNASNKSNEVAYEIGKLDSRMQKERRFIDTISAERVVWINKLRESFATFNKQLFVTSRMRNREKLNQPIDRGDFNNCISELVYILNLIELYLNPTERPVKRLLDIGNDLIDQLTDSAGKVYLKDEYEKLVEEMTFHQQVILKSEWARVKEEAEKGEQIDDRRMKELMLESAKSIDKQGEYRYYYKSN